MRWGILPAVGFAVLFGLSPPSRIASADSPPTAGKEARIRFAATPLSFETNQGQTDPSVKFLARGPGSRLFLTAAEAVFVLYHRPLSPPESRLVGDPALLGRRALRALADRERAGADVLRMKFVGADTDAEVSALDELPGKANYFIGADPSRWRTNISTYARVRYRNVYPGIDVLYYGNRRGLEYDVVLAPGADPGVIKLAFGNATRVELDVHGHLVLTLTGSVIRQQKPQVHQDIGGVRNFIDGRYVVTGDQVGIEVAAYDRRFPLVVDPLLSSSTYLGGSGDDDGFGITVDHAGNTYVTGTTSSPDFPTVAPIQATNGGGLDAFVAKLDATGSTLLYSTYLGGSDDDVGNGIAVDADGNAYVVGSTASTNFPTAKPTIQANYGGAPFDAFVAKLNATGSALVYSTYLGGGDDDEGLAIALDSDGNAYVTGQTSSTNFPTVNPLQASNAGGSDVFSAKVNRAGSRLVYSTYLGDSGDEGGLGIAVDAAGNAYVGGFTSSTNFPTVNPFQASNAGGFDAFVGKLSATGSALVFSTYLGGTGDDLALGTTVDTSGSAYVTGLTTSADFPTTLTTIQPVFGGGFSDAFVTKLIPTGSALAYSTYLGGNATDTGAGIALDAFGNAYLTGFTGSANFPTVSPVPAQSPGQNAGVAGDAFISKLDATGSLLLYSTYLGGSEQDFGAGIAVDVAGAAYVTGSTISADFPTTPGAFDRTYGGGSSDGFVAKIVDVGAPPPPPPTVGKVTGGGSIDAGGGTATFGFEVQRKRADEPIKGHLEYVDRASGAKVRSLAITSLAIAGNTAMFGGFCTKNGAACTFTVNVTDNGEPGRNDTFTISVSGGSPAGGALRTGNIKIHQ